MFNERPYRRSPSNVKRSQTIWTSALDLDDVADGDHGESDAVQLARLEFDSLGIDPISATRQQLDGGRAAVSNRFGRQAILFAARTHCSGTRRQWAPIPGGRRCHSAGDAGPPPWRQYPTSRHVHSPAHPGGCEDRRPRSVPSRSARARVVSAKGALTNKLDKSLWCRRLACQEKCRRDACTTSHNRPGYSRARPKDPFVTRMCWRIRLQFL